MWSSATFWENLNLQQFKVIQGDWPWCQSNAHMPLSIGPSYLIWSYFAPFLRYGDLLTENCAFSLTLSHLAPSLCSLWNFTVKLTTSKPDSLCAKLGVCQNMKRCKVGWDGIGLRGRVSRDCTESCMILTSTVFEWSTRVTDGRTDRRTEGR